MVGLELVLDERAAVGKAALADGAVEGHRGGGAELTMLGQVIPATVRAPAFTLVSQRLRLRRVLSEFKSQTKNSHKCLTSTPCAVHEWRASAAKATKPRGQCVHGCGRRAPW